MKVSVQKFLVAICCGAGLLLAPGCSSEQAPAAKDSVASAPAASAVDQKDSEVAPEEEEIRNEGAAITELETESRKVAAAPAEGKPEIELDGTVGQPAASINLESAAGDLPIGRVGEGRSAPSVSGAASSSGAAPVDAGLMSKVQTGYVFDARGRVVDRNGGKRLDMGGGGLGKLQSGDNPASAPQQGGGRVPESAAPGEPSEPQAEQQQLAKLEKKIERLEEFKNEVRSLAEDAEPASREAYDHLPESPFQTAKENPLSTFSIDVDTAAYSNMRRFLSHGNLPPAGAVRIEELINYFTYDYPQPKGDEPFATDVEIASAPWNDKHRLVRVGLQGKKIEAEQRPDCNLVFLIDTSGSMRDARKLPLVIQSLLMLAEELGEKDRVAIVTYAGSAGVLLPSVAGDQRDTINSAIENLKAGGSTNGSGGIRVAYEIARESFIEKGVNRVILATDGDFNVGVTNQSELVSLIEKEASSGVFLSVLGYGTGNLNDSTLEKLADKGNGNYAYIDTISEAKKVLSEQLFGTLMTIAKDVKIQIEFNPAHVAAYRLIGYENRLLAKEDFNDDKKDAGEIGSGHTVTALYEIVPVGVEVPAADVDPLKYQQDKKEPTEASKTDELLTLKLRYKVPDGDKSKLMEIPVKDKGQKFGEATPEFQFAAAVASFGMKLRHSKYATDMSLGGIMEIAQSAQGTDKLGYRAEFVCLVKRAQELMR